MFAVVAMLLSTGCRNPNAALTLPKEAGPVPVNLPRRETPAERAYWEQLAPARVIYIGEVHNSDSDHEYELDVLKGLRARDTRFTVAWEMFEVPQQPLLDAWDEHHLSTDALLQKTDFQAHWGSMSVFYEKILRWTQTENVPSLALNAPAALSHKLATGAPLDPEERAQLPSGFHPLPGGLEHFNEQMAQAPHGRCQPGELLQGPTPLGPDDGHPHRRLPGGPPGWRSWSCSPGAGTWKGASACRLSSARRPTLRNWSSFLAARRRGSTLMAQLPGCACFQPGRDR